MKIVNLFCTDLTLEFIMYYLSNMNNWSSSTLLKCFSFSLRLESVMSEIENFVPEMCVLLRKLA